MACSRWWLTPTCLLAIACGGSDPTGPEPSGIAGLVGTWRISKWEYTLAADPSHTVDWVALTGLSGALTITVNADFTVQPRLPGGFGSDFGHLTLQGDSLYWDGEDDEEWVRFTRAGSTLTLVWPEVELVDMDLDSVPEDVRLRVVLVRQAP
jgi:hypothetical protein